MQTALRSSIPDASLAVFPVNGENSHQGFEGRNPAPHPVREACKFTVLLGLRGQAELNRIGSRCTGKERDAESGLDYFGARYYSSNMGRWSSPDWSEDPDAIPYANLLDPQSFNLYAYVRNNPLSRVDDDGHCDTKTQDLVCIVQSIWNWITTRPGSQVAVGAYKELSNEGNDISRLSNRMTSTPTLQRRSPPPNYQFNNGWQKAGGVVAFGASFFFVPGADAAEGAGLASRWSEGTFGTVEESLAYHFAQHGAEVGAENMLQYLRKADQFAARLQGARRIEQADGAVKFIKNGRYVIKSIEGKILSFGLVSE